MSTAPVASRSTVPVPSRTAAVTKPSEASLVSSHGTTTIADAVVTKIAGLAAREVSGVHALGGGAARTIGALRERIPGQSTNASQGISVEVTDQSAAVEVDLVVEYGVAIAGVAESVRRNVITSVERMTGMTVTAVDVNVLDVFIPNQDSDSDNQ